MTISERIFKIMDEKGISQMDFSRGTGISQSTISDWKTKKNNPSSDKIMLICRMLNITPYELLQDTIEDDGSISNKDYIIVSEGTETYTLIEDYESLDSKAKDRLLGYVSALKNG